MKENNKSFAKFIGVCVCFCIFALNISAQVEASEVKSSSAKEPVVEKIVDADKGSLEKSFKERIKDILNDKSKQKNVTNRNMKNKLTSKLSEKNGDLLETAVGDVDGDKKDEIVELYGIRFSDTSIYLKELYVVVKDKKTKKIENAFELPYGGYDAQLKLSNIIGKDMKEILISAPTGGSGGIVNFSVWSLKNNYINEIFSQEDNAGIELEAKFLDNYFVQLYFPMLEKTIIMNLPRIDKAYEAIGLYDSKGNLLKNYTKPYMQGMIALLPMDTDGDGISELVFTQRIVGISNADTLGYVVGTLKYGEYSWNLVDFNLRLTLNVEPNEGDAILFGDNGYKIKKAILKTDKLNISYPIVSNLKNKTIASKINQDIESYIRSITENKENYRLNLRYKVLEKTDNVLKFNFTGNLMYDSKDIQINKVLEFRIKNSK